MSSEPQQEAVEPIVVAEFAKNKKETVRVSLTVYQGNELVDIRAFYPTIDGMKAGKGISLQRSQIVILRKALQAAERAIKHEPETGDQPKLGRPRRTAPAGEQ